MVISKIDCRVISSLQRIKHLRNTSEMMPFKTLNFGLKFASKDQHVKMKSYNSSEHLCGFGNRSPASSFVSTLKDEPSLNEK